MRRIFYNPVAWSGCGHYVGYGMRPTRNRGKGDYSCANQRLRKARWGLKFVSRERLRRLYDACPACKGHWEYLR